MVRTQIQLTEEELAALKALAADRSTSMAALVREAVVRCVRDGGRRSFNAAGCEIPDGTPQENLLAQMDALASLGVS